MIEKWSPQYREFIDRNIGLVHEDRQERLRTSKVCVFGIGGIGGTIFEILVRCGIGRFSIVDRDTFEASNLNRQIFAFTHTVGKRKIDVAEEWAKNINPEVNVEKYEEVDEENIRAILEEADVAALAIDELKPCVIISRMARKLMIPLVEGWAIPYGNVRTFTPETVSLEEAYGLPTKGRSVSEISDEEFRRLGTEVLLGLGKIEGLSDFYTDEVVNGIAQGHIPSFAPMVWFTAALMSLEVTKVLLKWGKPAIGPDFTLYDAFGHRIPNIMEGLPRRTR